jgi:hypothetical protein
MADFLRDDRKNLPRPTLALEDLLTFEPNLDNSRLIHPGYTHKLEYTFIETALLKFLADGVV